MIRHKTRKSRKRSSKKKVARLISVIIIVGILILGTIKLYQAVPDNINITLNKDENFSFDLPLPLEGEIKSSTGVLSINNKNVPSDEIKLNLSNPFTLKATEYGNHKINVKLFGFLNFKQVNVDVIENMNLLPAGNTIGIYIESDGIMVLGTGVIQGEDGLNYEPALNKLRTGDYITEVNGKKINYKEELMEIIDKSDGDTLDIQVRRDGEYLDYKLNPVNTSSGEYKIGVWIRDDTQGIGTLTFLTDDGYYGALGHGITDIDTSKIVEVGKGNIYSADIMTVVKGRDGEPGELIGLINQDEENIIGNIEKNTSQGIYGKVNNKNELSRFKALPVGLKQEVHEGNASILTCVDNKVEEYDVLIESVTLGSSNNSKEIVLQITDLDLLDKTGGIVQGMSGSPIIQDGKIIGAVTHVFIQDSTKGYGTFIENMIFNIGL